jgi:hypothetical protein
MKIIYFQQDSTHFNLSNATYHSFVFLFLEVGWGVEDDNTTFPCPCPVLVFLLDLMPSTNGGIFIFFLKKINLFISGG